MISISWISVTILYTLPAVSIDAKPAGPANDSYSMYTVGYSMQAIYLTGMYYPLTIETTERKLLNSESENQNNKVSFPCRAVSVVYT